MSKIILLSLFAVSALAVSACSNTLDGAGRDMEKAGQTLQKTF